MGDDPCIRQLTGIVQKGMCATPNIARNALRTRRGGGEPRTVAAQRVAFDPLREDAPKCNVDTYAEVGWFQPPKISKDMSTGKPIKRAYFQPRRQGEENFRPYTFSHASFGYDLVSVHCTVIVGLRETRDLEGTHRFSHFLLSKLRCNGHLLMKI